MKLRWRHVLLVLLIVASPLTGANCFCDSKLSYKTTLVTNVTLTNGVFTAVARFEALQALNIPASAAKLKLRVTPAAGALPTSLTFRLAHERGGGDIAQQGFLVVLNPKGKGRGSFAVNGVNLLANDSIRLDVRANGADLGPSTIYISSGFKI